MRRFDGGIFVKAESGSFASPTLATRTMRDPSSPTRLLAPLLLVAPAHGMDWVYYDRGCLTVCADIVHYWDDALKQVTEFGLYGDRKSGFECACPCLVRSPAHPTPGRPHSTPLPLHAVSHPRPRAGRPL